MAASDSRAAREAPAELAAAFIDHDPRVLPALWRAHPDLRRAVMGHLTNYPQGLVELAMADGDIVTVVRSMQVQQAPVLVVVQGINALAEMGAFDARYVDVVAELAAEAVVAAPFVFAVDERTLVETVRRVPSKRARRELAAAVLSRHARTTDLGWDGLGTLLGMCAADVAARWLTSPVGRCAPPNVVRDVLEDFDTAAGDPHAENCTHMATVAQVVWFHPQVGPWCATRPAGSYTAIGAALLGHLPHVMPEPTTNKRDLYRTLAAVRPEATKEQRAAARAVMAALDTVPDDTRPRPLCRLPKRSTPVARLGLVSRRRVSALTPRRAWDEVLVVNFLLSQLLATGTLTRKQAKVVRDKLLTKKWTGILGPIAAELDPSMAPERVRDWVLGFRSLYENAELGLALAVWEDVPSQDTATRAVLAVAAVGARGSFGRRQVSQLPRVVRAAALPASV